MNIFHKILFPFLFFFIAEVHAQKSSDARLDIMAEGVAVQEFQGGTIGVNLCLFPEGKVSLQYHVGIGVGSGNKFYMHCPAGGYLGVSILNIFKDINFMEGIGALAILVPEGIAYNIKLDEKSRISPYINFLSIDYVKKKSESVEHGWLSAALGIKYSYKINNSWCIVPHGGVKIIETNGIGFEAGISIGNNF